MKPKTIKIELRANLKLVRQEKGAASPCKGCYLFEQVRLKGVAFVCPTEEGDRCTNPEMIWIEVAE